MALSLKHARLCLDCDWLTGQASCSQCGGGQATVPIAGWFRPLDERLVRGGRSGKTATSPRRFILVVQHQQRELYRVLREALEGTGVEVFYERRVGQRRRRMAAGSSSDERRRADRRRPRPSAVAYEVEGAPAGPASPTRPSGGQVGVPVARPRRRQPTPV